MLPLRISKSSNITGTSPSDCLVSYPGLPLRRSYPSAKVQSLNSTVPADWAGPGWDLKECSYIYIYIYVSLCLVLNSILRVVSGFRMSCIVARTRWFLVSQKYKRHRVSQVRRSRSEAERETPLKVRRSVVRPTSDVTLTARNL